MSHCIDRTVRLLWQCQNCFRWNNSRKYFVKIKFAESMIDHLNIPSRIIEVESDVGKNQVSKFGIPESFAGEDIISKTKFSLLQAYFLAPTGAQGVTI